MRRAQKSRQFGLSALLGKSSKPSKRSAEVDSPGEKKPAPAAVPVRTKPEKPETAPAVESVEKRHWFKTYWRRVGGGSLSVSLGIHLIAIIIAIFIVTSTNHEPIVDFLPGGGSKAGQAASADVSNQVQRKRMNSFLQPVTRRVVSTSTHSAINLTDLPLERPEMPPISSIIGKSTPMGMGSAGSGGGFGRGQGLGGQSGFTNLPPMLQGRCNTADRLRKLKDSGGSPECESAVVKSLGWLKSKQNADGSWGNRYKCAMTGFALLSYLGHCETPDSPIYGDQVMKGLMYLMEVQRRTRYGVFSERPGGNPSTYEHGICTYAIGEMYTLSRMGSRTLPGLREAFERGVRVILDYQMPNGSWAYESGGAVAYSKGTAFPDLSVTGWQYQALKAAKYSGLGFTGLNVAIDKSVRYMEGTQTQDGGFGKTDRKSGYNQWNLSGAAILGLQTLGHDKSPAINRGIQFATHYFTEEPPDWKKNANLYCWYYYSQAFFQFGGTVWKGWNDRVLHQLLDNQSKNGDWNKETYDSPEGSSSYAGEADEPIYRTTLCTLMLEVYYRYLKVGDRESGSVFDRGK